MSPLTLVTGPPASGKTDALLARAAERYATDAFAETLILVPTIRHGDQIRRRLVARSGSAFRLRVLTVAQLSRELAADSSVAEVGVADELLHRTATAVIESGEAAYFESLADSDGLRRLVGAAISELIAEEIPPDALTGAAVQTKRPALVALAAIYRSYLADLAEGGWTHPAQLPLSAARAVANGSGIEPFVLVDGFQFLRGVELTLLEQIVRASDVTVAFDPDAGGRAAASFAELLRRVPDAQRIEVTGSRRQPPRTAAGETADREAQLRAMAREIKQRLTDDPSLRPSDCAVTFRQITPYLGLARQVFAEYDLPLDPAAGEPLASRPLGTWLRRLLRLADDGWRLRDLVTVLSSGFVDRGRWQLDAGDVARISRYGRERHLWAGIEALTRIAEGLRAEAALASSDTTRQRLERSADGLAAALEELAALIEVGPAPASEHGARLETALFGGRPLVRPSARRVPGVEVEIEALRGYLRSIGAADAALGTTPVPFSGFVDRLDQKLDAPAVLFREAGGVLLAPMHTLHSLRFAHVAIGGLIEGEFPAPSTSVSLLNGESRDALRDAGLALPPEPRAAEDELWASARSRADGTLSLWRSRLDERGRPAAASFYFDAEPVDVVVEASGREPATVASLRELAIAATRQWPSGGRIRPPEVAAWPVVRQAVEIEQRRRSFGHAGAFEGRVAEDLVPQLTGPEAVWSASRLESYRTCAFQFFGQYALRLRELDEEQDSADAATRGTVIHDVLQDALAPLVASGDPLTPATLPTTIRRLRENGPAIWNRAPVEYGFGRAALWRLDAEDVFWQLEALLEREASASAARGVTRVLGAEMKVDAPLPLDPPLLVTATVDRVDLGPDLAVVVDYKSGREIPRAQVMDGRRVQLQLYGYLARESAEASRVVARYAWLNPPSSEWDLDTDRAADAEVIDDVVRVAAEVRTAVEHGDFRVNPQVPACPTYCSFLHVCRVNEMSRWKRWD